MDIVLKSVPDGPVAKVQGTNIDGSAFVQLYRQELARAIRLRESRELPDEARAQLAMLVLGTLVEREVLYKEALDRELVLTEESVLRAWDAQQAQLREALSTTDGTEVSEEDILARLGFTEREEVLTQIRRAMLTEKMRATVIRESEVSISDEEVAEAFNSRSDRFDRPPSLHLKQIYLNPQMDSTEGGKARKRAENALERVFGGQRFESVARTFSDAPDHNEGGDMGRVPIDKLPPFMVEAAADLESGDVSDVIESKFGFHIIMLVERQEGSRTSIEELTPIIRRNILAQQGARVVREHCDALIEAGAEVIVFLELEKNLALKRGRRNPDGE